LKAALPRERKSKPPLPSNEKAERKPLRILEMVD
jgi:hypothetical protein